MTVWTVGLFVLGAVLLIGGAEVLVRGASRLALAAGISPLVVGLTVVAFGTSAPELAVTVGAAFGGKADVALGNVVGSNIFNILFVLGVSALVAPLAVSRQLVRLDVPLVISASVVVLLLALDGRVGRGDGGLLFAGIVVYTVYLVRRSRAETAEDRAAEAAAGGEAVDLGAEAAPVSWAMNLGLIGLGLVLLVFGSRWLVESAVEVATALGVSELVIGLTVVAAGTSLPEVATSVLAAFRGERDIAVGNAVGSNLFNLLVVLGLGSMVSPTGISVPPGALTVDLPIMIAVAVAALPIFFTGYVIARWEGALFLTFYGAYMLYLVFTATDHHAADDLRIAMIGFVLPLTAVTLFALAARSAAKPASAP